MKPILSSSPQNISEKFDDDYWLDCDINAKFPHEFYDEGLWRMAWNLYA